MKKIPFLIYCSLICLTLSGCGNSLQQGQQAEPAVTDSISRPVNKTQEEMDTQVTDESEPGYSTTPSGLKYRIVRAGSDTKPGAQDSVTVHYEGTLEDGTVFDSSYKRGETISFPLGNVIKGWTEGLQLIGEGGEIELKIPPDLGYGATGAPPVIPGNATLNFKVELFKVN
ncbi:MAG: FKBP-type peptidyl-prolyl cis-trans isomerase [Gimesia sp.]|nr:FKBP-type peptidyl-prolyl cis-trans isomerase [Gimesia sp.]